MGRRPRIHREEVLQAAREAFLDSGYEGTTLSNIGGRLGVSPAAVLRHAPTKKALFTAAMGATPEGDLLPLEFLRGVSGEADPRRVLRQVAQVFVPFIRGKLRENLARWVFFKRVSGAGTLPLPFDPEARPTPPQRNLRLLKDYLRRAMRRGRIRVRDPYAAAVAYLATLQSYVMLHEVMQALDHPLPLDDYLDTVLDIWTRGAIRSAKPTPRGRGVRRGSPARRNGGTE
jgi:AcrR family transcriptional regulator